MSNHIGFTDVCWQSMCDMALKSHLSRKVKGSLCLLLFCQVITSLIYYGICGRNT